MLEYKINVLEALKDAGYNSTRILRENILGQATVQRIRDGKMVGIKTIERLCEILDKEPGDIITRKK